MLLLDADIELAPRLVPALLAAARERDATLVSVLAELHCATFWERLLSPAFVFFFKLLYPFALEQRRAEGARPRRRAAACSCARTRLREIGGFAAIRGALIDDCTLAAALKRARPPIWLGMSHSVRSLRVYAALGDFWRMVSRSAFTQLRYSTWWLLAGDGAHGRHAARAGGRRRRGGGRGRAALGVTAAARGSRMAAAYWPVVSFYRLPAAWALTLPVAAALFLAMTWSSAFGYWRGTRASWKARDYGRAQDICRAADSQRSRRSGARLCRPECHRRVTALRPTLSLWRR